ncbi:zinc ABC transporter substrate-binding protein, partial [Limnoraphis robusta]|nr:zinc ABC transporter substrate-binding protein [Limnoraphis robusta]
HGHGHGHDHGHGHHHHHHGEFNPHIWLDPKRAIQQVENIRDGLIATDPEGAEKYTANAAAFIEKLRELDAEITQKLAPFAGQTFVVFHDFAPYFAERYNLISQSFVGIPEQNPSPQDVQRVMNTVAESGLQTILTEPQVDQDMFSTIARDMGIRVGVFNPIETGGPEAIEPEYYLRVMRQNAQNVLDALGGQTQSWLPLSTPKSVAVIPQPVGLRF